MSNSGMEKALETEKTEKRGRSYGGVAPEVRAAERRDALIRAATRVFGTVGFRKATVRSICQEAKLNDRYFYAAFDSTEDLLRCTYLHHAQQLHEAVARAVAERGGDLRESVDAGLAAFFAFLRDPCAARVLLLEVMGVSADTDMTYQRMLIDFGKLIMAIGVAASHGVAAHRLSRSGGADGRELQEGAVGDVAGGGVTGRHRAFAWPPGIAGRKWK
jgi:AcrR family transcriptional regulator